MGNEMYTYKWALLVGCLQLFMLGCNSAMTREIQDTGEVTYEVILNAPQTQMVEISMSFPSGGDESLEVSLPTWRPGKYSILDPVGTLRSFGAFSASGRALEHKKIAKSTWRIKTSAVDEVTVRYSIYANSLGDRTRHVDATHAFLSGSAVFMYTPKLRMAPVRVRIKAPASWKIAGGLELSQDDPRTLVAPNYDVLVDSPLELGEHDLIRFEAGGKPHEIVIWPRGVRHDAANLIEDFTKIIDAQAAIFGSMPFKRYVFLIHASSRAGGGTEHLNSTIMQTSRTSVEGSEDRSSSYKRFLGLVSHEYFHTWNVKALRPVGINPYNYLQENYTDLLWVAEGTTSYYTDLILARNGLNKAQKYVDGLGSSINSSRLKPGTRHQSVSDSSFDAWTTFNERSQDDYNTEVSIYSRGSLVSLALDMELRQRSKGKTDLDAVMRAMFERFPLSGPGYSQADLIAVMDELSSSSFANFFKRHVDGTERLPLEQSLLTVGLELHFKANQDERDEEEDEEEAEGDKETPEPEADAEPKLKAYLGLRLSSGGSGSNVSRVHSDGPAYSAGILPGDEIIAMNGRRLRSGDLDKRLKRLEPGQTVTLHLLREDDFMEVRIALNGVPDGSWSLRRVKDPSEAQMDAYSDWIGQPWPGRKQAEEAEAETLKDIEALSD